MNTAKLEKFAPAVRRQLIEAVERKLDYALKADTADLRAKAAQVAALRREASRDRAGLIERVAYTWFNRLAALRFLDARGWHPFGARVITPATGAESQPELLKLMRNNALPRELTAFTNVTRLNDLLDGRLPTATPNADAQGEVYRELILAACRFYHDLMPFLYEELDDETELLLPDDLLTEQSVAHGLRTEISDDDCAEVEVLGWLYQFYIAEKKDEVMARKKAVPSEDIPAVTQLFTPHWIVRYLVENSLGRLWLLNHAGSRLREHMPYYVEGEGETDFLKISSPEDIRLLDPACGSGHMLTYAFDLLYRIYEEEGYAPSDIPALILQHNLHGLEICPRATQLAQFALTCKAREKSRAAFRQPAQPNVMCLQDVVIGEDELRSWLRATGLQRIFTGKVIEQLHQFRSNTATFGSLIVPLLNADEITSLLNAVGNEAPPGDLFLQDTHRKIRLALNQALMLSQRYNIMVANPPYMGSGRMNSETKAFASDYYWKSKADLFALFIERAFLFIHPNGYAALLTMQSWMFLSSFDDLRRAIVLSKTILSMAHQGPHAFDTIGGEVVQVTAFVANNLYNATYRGQYFRLVDGKNEAEKSSLFLQAIANPACGWLYHASAEDFMKIPTYPIAYWASRGILDALQHAIRIDNFLFSDGLTKTGNNEIFLRKIWEVDRDTALDPNRYRICVKGGSQRRYFGNTDTLVNWSPPAREHYRNDHVARITPEYLWNAQGISWTKIASTSTTFRWFGEGMIAETVGPAVFAIHEEEDDLYNCLGFLSSKVGAVLLYIVNPTLSFQTSDILKMLIVDVQKSTVSDIVQKCITLARDDWDSHETSWDFVDLPLLRLELKGSTLVASWRNWEAYLRQNITRMQELETENNRLWIEAYGLQDELTPEVPEEEITLARPDRRKDMAAFLSYAVGCMMGRYSLDKPGLILADAGDTLAHYAAKVGKALDALPFVPDEDGIIPVLDGEWFADDVVARARQFLVVTFGAEALAENLRFIEESLGKDLRKYFMTDFYRDHLQTYKKRPIYWMFQSPRKGFQCLIYLHRYTRDTANRVLNRYLREYLVKLRGRISQLEHEQTREDIPARDKTRALKEIDQLRKTLRECEEWERDVLLPLAQQRIELDLDDGVKVNYLKLGAALAPIAGLAAREEEE